MSGQPFGGADRCDATHYATTSGTGSRIFCLVAKVTWAALRQTTGCLLKLFCTDIELASRGAICLSALVLGRSSISALVDGRRVGFSSAFSTSWPATMITST